jgi:hypothetical protein
MLFPVAAATGVTQERIGWPSRCTVQAPHSAMPQPNLVPVRPITSRSTHSNGISGGTSTVWTLPLILSVIMTVVPRQSIALARTLGEFNRAAGVVRRHAAPLGVQARLLEVVGGGDETKATLGNAPRPPVVHLL